MISHLECDKNTTRIEQVQNITFHEIHINVNFLFNLHSSLYVVCFSDIKIHEEFIKNLSRREKSKGIYTHRVQTKLKQE
jgi:hypothetical protein